MQRKSEYYAGLSRLWAADCNGASMEHSDISSKQVRSFSARVGGMVGLLLAVGLLLTTPASATYEQVNTFGTTGEGRLITENGSNIHPTGVAVNTTGAGGVPAGTVYVVAEYDDRVFSYNPQGEFREAWEYGGGEGSPGTLFSPNGISVDQATGNVYVINAGRKHDAVQIFSANGTPLGGFGERAANGETIDESPEKIHELIYPGGVAVDESGVVYVADIANNSGFDSRVMVFEPQTPGDFEHYVYAGRAKDVAAHDYPRGLAIDFDGNLYVHYETGQEGIYEFAPGQPDTPVCEYTVPGGGILGMTVNPESGEPFYFSYKNREIHGLSACNPQGKFEAKSKFAPSPKADWIPALGFNPALAYEASRPRGILYALEEVASLNVPARGIIFAPAQVHSPSVDSESVSAVGNSSATLGAQINPHGSETHYVFQYITDAAYQANEPAERFAGAGESPLGGASLGSGQSPLSAGVSLVGLQPDTTYHYRAVATSHCNPEDEEETCEGTGGDQTFHTFPVEPPRLPDARAYELVSPAQKNGGEVIPIDPASGSCSECKPASFTPAGGFPMQSAPGGEAVVYEGFPFSFSGGAAIFSQYISRRTESGWQTTNLSPELLGYGNGAGYKAFDAGLTQGLIYQFVPSLTPDAPSEYANLYTQPTAPPSALTPLLVAEPPNRLPGHLALTYAGASADLSQLFFEANDALTGETPFAPEAVDGGEKENNLYEWKGGQLQLVNVLPGNAETAPGAEFASGIQLASNPNSPAPDFSHAISEDGSRVFWSDGAGQVYVREDGEATMQIPDSGRFLTASADGSKVLLSNGHLYDLETEETTDLSAGKGGFEGILGQSEDLSRIYFVDTAVLSGEEENDHGAKAQVGEDNLYAWQEGAVAFIATLAPGDVQTLYIGTGDWTASPAGRTAEASPDGGYLAFMSRAKLTGYDNRLATGECIASRGPECPEVFLYDSAAGKLICASCNPSGTRPLGMSKLGVIQGAHDPLPQPRYLTDQGRLYFDSQDSLTPFDTNDGVEDVYQYEPQGVGSCKREGGCVSLISAGHEPIDSNFFAADPEGKSVFFTSRDQLVLKDRDELIDLYVAREDGGIPAETETARSECQGETCQPAAVLPNDPTPSSSSFQGAGNVVEKKATRKHKNKHKHAKKHKRKRAAKHNRGGTR